MRCPFCGKEVTSDSKFCTGCGNKLPCCPTCGNIVSANTRFCPFDGTPIPDAPAASQTANVPNSQTTSVPPTQTVQYGTTNQQHSQAPGKKTSGANVALWICLGVMLVAILVVVGIFAWSTFSSGDDEELELGNNNSATLWGDENSNSQNQNPYEDFFDDNENEDLFWEELPEATLLETQWIPETTEQVLYMPNCVGLTENEAEHALQSMGLSIHLEYERSSYVQKDYVIRQSIPADRQVEPSTTVTLVISLGQDEAPEGYNQKVVVSAYSGSSYGTLTLYNWQNGSWVSQFSCDATVGSNGISYNYGEGTKRTPRGTFKLGVALSASSIPNYSWPFRMAYYSTCIVDDIYSPYYNMICDASSLSSSTSRDPIGEYLNNGKYNILLYIEHNGNGLNSNNVVRGNGSVITICGKYGGLYPTAGCVDISASNMYTLVSLLDASKNTHIEIKLK